MLLLSFVALVLVTAHAEAQYYASKKSDRYHVASCRYVRAIHPENLTEYRTKSDAEADGKTPCKVCTPSGRSGGSASGGNGTSPGGYTPGSGGSGTSSKTMQSTERRRCEAITKRGTQCKRMADAGSRTCWQHSR